MDKITVDNSKNEKYWQDRIILKDKLLERDIKKIEKELLKIYKDTKKEVLNELKILYSDMEHTEYAKYRIESLLSAINKSLDNLYSGNEEALKNGLEQIYKEMYKQASIDLEASFNTINDDLIKEVTATEWGTKLNDEKDVFVLQEEVRKKLEENWSGATLIERIQEHKRKLSFTLKEELTKGLIRGDSLQEISKRLSDKMDLAYSNSMRIVRTESCWIMNEATKQNYLDNDIKYYEFSAFLDKKTSKICKELDGKVIKVEEAIVGKNMPPLHPNCRSCMIPITEELKFEKTKKVETESAKNKLEGNSPSGIKFKNIDDIENEFNKRGYLFAREDLKVIDKDLLISNSNRLIELIDKYPKVQEYINKNKFSYRAFTGTSAIARCESDVTLTGVSISLSKDKYKNKQAFIKDIMDGRDTGFFMDFDDKYLETSSITHEFGHFIHNVVIKNYNEANKEAYDKMRAKTYKAKTRKAYTKIVDKWETDIIKPMNNEIIEIAKTLDKDFVLDNSISTYGKTSPHEFFAECFANAECGKPNTLGKAMKIYLERNFK